MYYKHTEYWTDIVFYFIYKLLKFIDKSGKSCKKYPAK